MCLIQNMDNLGWETFYWLSIMVAQQSNGEWGSIAGGKQATQSFITGNPLRALSNKNWSKSKN